MNSLLDLPLLAARLFNTPLMVKESKLRAVIHGLGPRFGVRPGAFDDYDDSPRERAPRKPYQVTPGGVALVPVDGVLANRNMRMDTMSSAMRSYESILADVAMALNDSSVKGIVLNIESPGGEAMGCFDAAAALAAMRGVKPIVASANAYAYSAAYAIASATDRIFVPTSGEVGSIGVVAAHADQSGADEKMGIEVTYIFRGAHKVDGNPHEPLSKPARKAIEQEVDYLYDLFVNGVAANRGISADKVRSTEARCLNAAAALEAGIADQIGSLSDAIAYVEQRAVQKSPTRGRVSARTSTQKVLSMNEDETAQAEAQLAAAANAAKVKAEQDAAIAAAVKEATDKALAHAAEITAMCTRYGRPQDAQAHIAANRSKGEVAEALLAAMADTQSTTISSVHPVGDTLAQGGTPDDPHGWEAAIRRTCGSVAKGN